MTWAEFVCWTAIVRQAVDIEIIGIFVSRTLIIVIRILQISMSTIIIQWSITLIMQNTFIR